MIRQLIKRLPFIGKFLTRYDRALVCLNDERFYNSRAEIIATLDKEPYWKERRESKSDDWSEFPFA